MAQIIEIVSAIASKFGKILTDKSPASNSSGSVISSQSALFASQNNTTTINNINNSQKAPELIEKYTAAKNIQNGIRAVVWVIDGSKKTSPPCISAVRDFNTKIKKLITALDENVKYLDQETQKISIQLLEKIRNLRVNELSDLPPNDIFKPLQDLLKCYLEK